MSSKIQNLKAAKGLASEITESGAKLFDLLSKEPELKEGRDKALSFLDNLSKNLDSSTEQEYIRRSIRDIIQNQESSLSQMEKMLAELEKDEKNLETKIKKRSVELERAEKRMKSIEKVRPAFMDEYDRLEQELEKVYEYYVLKYRNLTYLERDLEVYSKMEQDKELEVNKKLDQERQRIKDDEFRVLRGDNELEEPMAGGGRIGDLDVNRERPMEARANNRRNYNLQEESEDSDLIDEDEEEDDIDIEEDDEVESESSNEDF